jgi:secondary thiamine-phosphate synthase enzyme
MFVCSCSFTSTFGAEMSKVSDEEKALHLHQDELTVATRGRAILDITQSVAKIVGEARIARGLCTVFVHHTSASLMISENADPVVLADLERFFARLVPDGDKLFKHTDEGPDDMPSHVRSVLTQTSLGIPIAGGKLDLGVWQGIYLYEHRHAPHSRRVSVTIVGAA